MSVLHVIFILSWLHGEAFGLCNHGWHEYRDKCYHINQDPATWIQGMKMCEYHGGKLVQIKSVIEDIYIKSLLRHRYQDADYWIGGSDWTVEGEWLWEPDGIPMTYTDWYPGQPNNGMAANAYPFAAQQEHQNCLAMLYDHKYQWIDSNCDDYKHTICEKRAVVPVTTPGYTDTYSTMKTTTTTPTTRTTTSSTTMTTTETPSTYTTAPPTTTAPTPRPTTPKEIVETQTPTTVKEIPVTMTTTMKQTTPEETMPKETTTTTMKTTTTEQEFVLIGRGIL